MLRALLIFYRRAANQWDLICVACREGQGGPVKPLSSEGFPNTFLDSATNSNNTANSSTSLTSVGKSDGALATMSAPSIATPAASAAANFEPKTGNSSAEAQACQKFCDFCPLRGEMFVFLLLQHLKRSDNQAEVFCNNAPAIIEARNQVFFLMEL